MVRRTGTRNQGLERHRLGQRRDRDDRDRARCPIGAVDRRANGRPLPRTAERERPGLLRTAGPSATAGGADRAASAARQDVCVDLCRERRARDLAARRGGPDGLLDPRSPGDGSALARTQGGHRRPGRGGSRYAGACVRAARRGRGADGYARPRCDRPGRRSRRWGCGVACRDDRIGRRPSARIRVQDDR